MKLSGIILSITLGFTVFSQQFEIPQENYPFYDVVEWKGFGAMLLNRDPAGVTKKVNLTLVGNATTSLWQQSFNPNGKDFYYISSENARYVYFLDDLNLNAGKISLHQLSSAGNVKSTSIALGAAIKKLGDYDITQLQLMDVVTTDKALVHIFRYLDKKEKKYVEIATFVTHHNFLIYAAKLGETNEIGLKEGTVGHWHYAGFNGDNIYFAAKDKSNKKNGWAVQNFTSKGELKEGTFVQASTEKFEQVEQIGLGTSGKVYLQSTGDLETSSLIHHNGHYYCVGIITEGTTRKVILQQLVEGTWKTISSAIWGNTASKKAEQLGCYVLNEGMGCKIGGKLVFLPNNPAVAAIVNPFSAKINANPSRWMIAENKEYFAVSLAEGNLFFDLQQLNKPGNVKFEFKKK